MNDQHVNRSKHLRLPKFIRSICEGGSPWENYHFQSQYAARKSVVYHLINQQFTFPEASHYLLGDQTRPSYELWGSSRQYLTYPQRMARLIKDWQQAVTFHAQHAHTRVDVTQYCGELRALTDTTNWKGVAGENRRTVLLIAIGYAETTGCMAVRLPVRELALKGIMGTGTASRTLKWLTDNKILTLTRDDRTAKQGVQYRLPNPEAFHHVLQSGTNWEPVVSDSEFVPVRNTVEPEATAFLGKKTIRIGTHLTGTPQTAAELARNLGCHRSTATRALTKLEAEGLAERVTEGWVTGPKNIEKYHPGTDITVKRELKIIKEREEFRGWTPQQQAHIVYLNKHSRFLYPRKPSRIPQLRAA